MSSIKIEELNKTYNPGASNEVVALAGVSFALDPGEFTVILGPSGAGKSTLLNILGGMDTASSGHYFVGDSDVVSFNEKRLSAFRRVSVGFVFQFYNLMPNLTAIENVELAASVAPHPFKSQEILEHVGLADRLRNFPSQLSGGEQQRVAIARALVKNPELLLCDEPTGALDSKTGASILSLLLDTARQYRKTVILVTHNSKIAEVASRVIRIRDGHLESDERVSNPRGVEEIAW